ncbi:MAG: hypothetical protein ACRD3W_15510, partial [Terriglobales bacterium]
TAGNAKPRLFRLPADNAIINRLGLNGDGCDAVAARLRQCKMPLPLAVNIAKTNDPAIKGDAAINDQVSSFIAVRDLPLAYVTLNASCPNTHEGILAAKEELDAVLAQFQKENRRNIPLFVKLSPDSSDRVLEDFVAVSGDRGIAGFVCGNTTVSRTGLRTGSADVAAMGAGGLSGPPLKDSGLALVSKVSRLKSREQEIIGCGGIGSGKDALAFIKAGASAVQIYTALVYQGPAAPARINRELAALVKQEGCSLQELVGSAAAAGAL